jgi:IS605 OrfB family transposase
VSTAVPFEPEGVIGVDLGMVNVATDSEGNRYTGEPLKKVRRKYRAFRQCTQSKKTRSARKRMAKKRRKESRFVRDVNHCVSKSLVGMALHRKKALAVEMLEGIRGRGNRLNRAMRTELNHWAFAQLKSFLAYKCKKAGVPLLEVDARYSSQQCSRCAHTERANRPSQEVFCCRHCCFQSNADVNAAKVLEARATLSTGPRFYLAVLAARGGQVVPPSGGGALAILSGTRHDPLGYDVRLEAFGTADSIAVGLDHRSPIHSVEPGAPTAHGAGYRDFMDRFEPAYRAELEAFVANVRSTARTPCSLAQARAAMQVALAADRSRAERRPIAIEEIARASATAG